MRYDKRRAGLVAAAAALVTVGLAACGGGGPASPGVAGAAAAPSASASTPSASAAAGGSSAGRSQGSRTAQGLAYAQCMRSHGVTSFPDPVTTGQAFKVGLSGLDPNSPQFQSAQDACRPLAPSFQPNPAAQQQELDRDLKYAQCMRAHGISISDPTQGSGGFVEGPQVAPSEMGTPQYQSAQQACQSDLGTEGEGGGGD